MYLVHFLRMQSQPWLQEGEVSVVINFLARQRGSYVTMTLPACMRQHDISHDHRPRVVYQHQQQMSISLDAAAYAVVYSLLLLHDAHSLPSLTLSGADWTFKPLISLTGTIYRWSWSRRWSWGSGNCPPVLHQCKSWK